MDRIFWAMPKAVFTVMFFWYLVTTVFFSGEDIWLAGERLMYAVAAIAIAWVGGVLIWNLFYRGIYKEHLMDAIETDDIKEVKFSLYTSSKKNCRILHPRIPLPLDKIPSSRMDLKVLKKWDRYSAYKKQFPYHAKLFESVFRILSHYSYLPATQHKEGHGGLSLLEHSLNVVRLMDKLGGQFKYYGIYNNNKLITPLRDEENLQRGYYQFDANDPILPIIALSHDLGKILAYKLVDTDSGLRSFLSWFIPTRNNGLAKVERVSGDHDLLGKKLLLKVPEIYLISWKERNDLLSAVGYHHHYEKPTQIESYVIQGLPYSNLTSDRQHALAALLSYVDTQTSMLEGGQKIKPFFIPDSLAQTKKSTQSGGEEKTEAGGDKPEVEEVDRGEGDRKDVPEEGAQQNPDSQNGATESDEVEGQVYKWLVQLIKSESKSKKGNSKLNRLNGWVYLDEMYWRNWLFKQNKPVPDPEALTLKNPVNVHQVTIELLNILEEKGGMPTDVEVDSTLPKLFMLSVERNHGGPFVRDKVIVFKESLMPFKISLRKSRKEIKVIGQAGVEENNETQNDPVPPETTKNVQTPQAPNGQNGSTAQNTSEIKNDSKETGQLSPEQSEPKEENSFDAVKANVDKFIEWVTLVQNLELPDETPFPEIKEKGRPYALVDVLAIPRRFIEGGQLIGIDPRIELNEEQEHVKVPIEHRKRMRG